MDAEALTHSPAREALAGGERQVGNDGGTHAGPIGEHFLRALAPVLDLNAQKSEKPRGVLAAESHV